MTALVFLFAVAVIFGAVLAIEVRDSEPEAQRRPLGLIAWLTGGNWPAKVGGGLLVVGVGSLLRYALINLDVAPSIKLATGVVAAGLLGLAAMLTRLGSARRAVSLALGGAAFGVAYLTAYSAFGLFHYLDSVTGVALLALTAVGAGVYAVTRSALSLALLAMLGAFLAPAFALTDPGPSIVYGYYAAASLLTLVMVALRGWRPLIHLSFVFTLAGGVFFAWTKQYFTEGYAPVMLPALLVLTALHLLMPLFERGGAPGTWLKRLDLVYMLALPTVAAFVAMLIAPSRGQLSNELLALGALWLAVAGYLWSAKRDGLALHAIIGVLLVGIGVATRYRDLPWELIALAFTVAALWIAARLSTSERLHNALAGLVPLFGLLHVVSSLAPIPGSPVFLNGRFLERLIGAGLLMFAGHICRGLRQSLDTLLWSVGIGWALIAIGVELVRWDLVSLALVIHWALLVAVAALALTASRAQWLSNAFIVAPLGMVATASLAVTTSPPSISWATLIAAPCALLVLAISRDNEDPATRAGRLWSAVLVPVVAAIWATHCGQLIDIRAAQFALSIAAGAALLVLIAGEKLPARSADWLRTARDIFAFAFAAILLVATTIVISRSSWAMLLEVLAFAGLLWLVYSEREEEPLPIWLAPLCALGLGLLLQAHLLRWLGPSGDLDISDIARMRLPAMVSLLWAGMGGVLTIWGRKRLSRPLWIAGAALLAAAAVKMVLIDFGSLGELANIFAVIGAGIVFVLVGWLAPMPPAAAEPSLAHAEASRSPKIAAPANHAEPIPVHSAPAASTSQSSPSDHTDRSNDRIAWAIAIFAGLILPLAQCHHSTFDQIRKNLGHSHSVRSQRLAPPSQSASRLAEIRSTPQTPAHPHRLVSSLGR